MRLLGEHDQSLGAYIYSLVPQWSDAQDIAQEVRLRLWDQFDEYDASKDFGAWARTIARYMVLAARERQTRRQFVDFDLNLLESISEEFERFDAQIEGRRRALNDCLQKLAESSRTLLLRCYSGRENLQEVAAASGRSYEATRKAVQRIRHALSRCVENYARENAP